MNRSWWAGSAMIATLALAGSAAAQAERYLPGHKETTWVIEFSPDGSRLVTSDATTMNVWSVPAFTLVAGPYEPGVTTAAFSTDARRLYRGSVTVSVDEVGARVFGNEPLFKLEPRTVALAMELSPDGQLLVVADTTSPLRGIDATTGAVRFSANPADRILALAFSKDGKSIFAGSKSGDLIHYRSPTGEEVGRFTAYDGAVRALAVSPNGAQLALCGDNESWTIDLATNQRLAPIGLDCAGVEYTKDGKHLVTTSSAGLLLWDAKETKLVRKLTDKPSQGLAISPDGRFIAASIGAHVRVFDLSLVLLPDFIAKRDLWRGAEGPVTSVAALPDNRTLLTASKGKIQVWDRTRGIPLRELADNGPITLDGKGQLLVAGDPLQLFDPKSGKTKRLHPRPADLDLEARPRALSKKGDLLLVGGAKVELFDLKKGKARFAFEGPCAAVAFTPKENQVVVGCDDATVKVLDLAGNEKRLLSGHLKEIVDIALSSDGKVVASAGKDGAARAWEISTGRPLYQLDGDSGHVMQSVALSPDGNTLAAGGATGKLTVIDLKKKQTLFEARHFEFVGDGFAGSVADLQFIEKGKVLVSASWNRNVTFWRVADGAALSSFGAWRPYEILAKIEGAPREASPAEKLLFFAAQDLERGPERARVALSVQPPLDYRDGDYTSLMVACEKGNVAVASLLIAAGADVNAQRGSNENCLTSAVRKGNLDMVKALIAGKANVNHVKESQKETPLILASALRHKHVAEALVAAGADVHAATAAGATALSFAVQNDDADMVRVLAAAKANVNAVDPAGVSLINVAARNLAESAYAALVEAGADTTHAEKLDVTKVVMGKPKRRGADGADVRAPQLVPGEGRPLRTAYRGKQVRIVNPGRVYDTINGSDCLSWPSPNVKANAGRGGWGRDYKVTAGEVGTVIFESLHCAGDGSPTSAELILIVQVGERFLPASENAIEPVGRPPLNLQEAIRRALAEELEASLAKAEREGRRARISNAKWVYSTINTTDCLNWPWPQVKAKAGGNAWKDYTPATGDEGVIIFTTPHCLEGEGKMYIIKVGEHYVPVGERGIVAQ